MEHTFADNPDIRRNFTGRVIRINRDGSIPKDNPWLSRATVLARDLRARLQGSRRRRASIRRPASSGRSITARRAATRSTSSAPGKDYGWPDVSLRHAIRRAAAGRPQERARRHGATSRQDVEEPIYYWVPSIAPSGMMFYTGDLFPEWKGNLFIGAMAGQHLVRLVLNGERVVAEEQLLAEQKQRVREVGKHRMDRSTSCRVHPSCD